MNYEDREGNQDGRFGAYGTEKSHDACKLSTLKNLKPPFANFTLFHSCTNPSHMPFCCVDQGEELGPLKDVESMENESANVQLDSSETGCYADLYCAK